MARLLFSIFVLGMAISCGIGVNPLTRSDLPIDPSDVDPDAVPGVANVTPTTGTRGTAVTITGSNFSESTKVKLGASPCHKTTVVSATELTCIAGANGPGMADLTLTNAAGVAVTQAAVFEYRSFLYQINGGGSYKAWRIATTGELTEVDTGTTGNDPKMMWLDPFGRFLFYLSNGQTKVYVFSINNETGVLTAVGQYPAGPEGPKALGSDKDGKFLYVSGSNAVVAHEVDQTTGNLTPLGEVLSGRLVEDFALMPGTGILYLGDNTSGDGELGAVTSQASGFFDSVPGMPLDIDNECSRVAVTDGFVISIGDGSSEDVFEARPDGSAVYKSTFQTNQVTNAGIFVGPSGTLVASYDGNSGIVYTQRLDRASASISALNFLNTNTSVTDIKLDPNERFIFGALPSQSSVVTWGVDPSTGALTEVSSADGGVSPRILLLF